MSKNKQSVFLEVDESICQRNYLINSNTEEDELNKLLQSTSNLVPSATTITKPTPGFCVKSHQKGTDKKVFINICQTDAIPAPRDISDAELVEILDKDEICDFRVPMSIGGKRTEQDKKGQDALVCDIAINADFFAKVERSDVFKQFLIAVAFEGFQQKFNVEVDHERLVLKNRKAMGTLQTHHIQQREVERKLGVPEKLPSIDQMLQKNNRSTGITILDDKPSAAPKYRLFTKKSDPRLLFGEFYMPYVSTAENIQLLVGEDRILLESKDGKYFLDTFHDYKVDRNLSTSDFDKNSKFLTLKMPFVGEQAAGKSSTLIL